MPTTEDKLLAASAHLGYLVGLPFIAPLVVWLWKREESPFVAGHAKHAMGLHVGLILLVVLIGTFTLVTFGVGLIIAVPVFLLAAFLPIVWSIMAVVKVSVGEPYRYPIVGRVVDNF